jgi:hypothetical protein
VQVRSNLKTVLFIFKQLLDAFAELRKATISFVMSVCSSVRPSVHMEQIYSYRTDFHEIFYLIFFENVSRKFVFLKIDPE